MDPDAVAKAFVEHYYSTFDANRAGLANLYQESSMLTFEGQKIQGSRNIVAKLTSLPFQQCQHSITTVDRQTSGPAGSMLIFVSGKLHLAGEQHALKFSQGMRSYSRGYYIYGKARLYVFEMVSMGQLSGLRVLEISYLWIGYLVL